MNKERILIDEIVKHKEMTARILVVLATVGVASDGQLMRLCTTLSQHDKYKLNLAESKEARYHIVMKEVESMYRTDGYLNKETGVQLPKQMGGGTVNVWYLTAKGVAATRVLDEYFVRFACTGLPCGKKKDRIPHELAVTESFLKLTEKQVICDFIPERELKSRLMKRRHELRRQGINPAWHKETAGEETGDFRAELTSKNSSDNQKFTIEGEAAINYRRAQIEAKPDDMIWFVTSKTQKDLVIATKKEQVNAVWILSDVASPVRAAVNKTTVKENGFTDRKRNKLGNKISEYLRLRNETYTGKALAGILNEQSQHVYTMLQRLSKAGILNSEEVKLTPGHGRGRPNKLYWHVKNDDEIVRNRATKTKSIVFSEMISYLTRSNYKFRNYSDATRQADFTPLDATKFSPVKVVIESPELSKNQLKEKIERANQAVKNTTTEVIIAVSTTERYEEITELCALNKVLIIDKKVLLNQAENARK